MFYIQNWDAKVIKTESSKIHVLRARSPISNMTRVFLARPLFNYMLTTCQVCYMQLKPKIFKLKIEWPHKAHKTYYFLSEHPIVRGDNPNSNRRKPRPNNCVEQIIVVVPSIYLESRLVGILLNPRTWLCMESNQSPTTWLCHTPLHDFILFYLFWLIFPWDGRPIT